MYLYSMGQKKFSPNQFLKYITQPLSAMEMQTWVKANNILPEMSDLFYDFICGMYTLVNETYLGIEVMSEPEDIKKHFDWCWNRTINNFEKEGIYFNSEGPHKDYFWAFFEDSYYVHGSPIVYDKMNQFFTKLFKFTNRKTKSELDIYTDLYKMLEKNINYV